MKKKCISTIILAILGILPVLIMEVLSRSNYFHYGNFLRLIPPHPFLFSNTLDIKYNSYYVAGATQNRIYFGNTTAPLHLLSTNYSLDDTQTTVFDIQNLNHLKLKNLEIRIDSPNIFATNGIKPILLKGDLKGLSLDRYMFDSAYFTLAEPLGKSSFAIRTLNQDGNQYVLAKETAYSPYLTIFSRLLEKQVDGMFCTDGMLNYDEVSHRLVYLYYYRNQFICMDSNLNLLYRGKTIDTISHAQIKVARMGLDNSYTLSTPPLLVNKKSCVSDNFLFVNSNLVAKNEDQQSFDNGSAIDVYNLTDGAYKFSFYIHDLGKIKMGSFRVFNKTLIALFDHYVVSYSLSPTYFK